MPPGILNLLAPVSFLFLGHSRPTLSREKPSVRFMMAEKEHYKFENFLHLTVTSHKITYL